MTDRIHPTRFPRTETRSSRRGFTLVELTISALIISLIALVLMVVFRGNLTAWKWGQKHMEFNQKIQLAMKQIFTDLKKINPMVVMDGQKNLLFQGEKLGEFLPNLVEIVDLDLDPNNGGEEIRYVHTSYNRPGERVGVRLFLEKDDKNAKDGALMREVTDVNGARKRTVISNRVSDLHFQTNLADIREVRVGMLITDDRNPELRENLSFAVSLDTDLVCVKFLSQNQVRGGE